MVRGGGRFRARQELAHYVPGGVGFAAGLNEPGEVRQVVAGGDQRQFVRGVQADLTDTDDRGQTIADALAADGLFGGTALAEIIVERLGRAPVAYVPSGLR